MAMDTPRIEAAVREILAGIGEDPDRDGLRDTPARVARMYAEVFQGLEQDAHEPLSTTFDIDHQELVLVRDIAFYSMCEHHLLPFAGHAHLAYLPGEQVVGLGALVRVVEILASRPQVQERLGEQIADAIADNLDARGVLVVLDASHGCVTLRGGRQPEASTLTIAARGVYAEPAARGELIALIASPSAATP